MRRAAAAEVVPLVEPGKASPFGNPDHVNALVHRELVHQNFVAHLHLSGFGAQPHLSQKTRGIGPPALEVARQGLG